MAGGRLPEGYDVEAIMDEYLSKVMPLHKDYVYWDDVVNMVCICDPRLTVEQVRVYTILLKRVLHYCTLKKGLRVSVLGHGNLTAKKYAATGVRVYNDDKH